MVAPICIDCLSVDEILYMLHKEQQSHSISLGKQICPSVNGLKISLLYGFIFLSLSYKKRAGLRIESSWGTNHLRLVLRWKLIQSIF